MWNVELRVMGGFNRKDMMCRVGLKCTLAIRTVGKQGERGEAKVSSGQRQRAD